MRKEYDFSKGKRNPYVKRFKQQVTIRIDKDTLAYFKSISRDMGIPYQTLINFYLRECALAKVRPRVGVGWGLAARKGAA